MLLIAPEYATLREERERQTIDWLTGNFSIKPLEKSVPEQLARPPAGQRQAAPRKRRRKRQSD
jgi:hypothetical protein